MKPGDASPWGTIQHVKDYGLGVFRVSTAGHGGVYVPDELLHNIPEREQEYAAMWSGSRNWYEEDCAAVIPLWRLSEINWGIDHVEAKSHYDEMKHYWEDVK